MSRFCDDNGLAILALAGLAALCLIWGQSAITHDIAIGLLGYLARAATQPQSPG